MHKKVLLCAFGAALSLTLLSLLSPETLPLTAMAEQAHTILFDSSTNCPSSNGDFQAKEGVGVHPLSTGGYVQVHTECQSCSAVYGSSSFVTVKRSLASIYYLFELSAIGLSSFLISYTCSNSTSITYCSFSSPDYSGTPLMKDVPFSSGSEVTLSEGSRSVKLDFSIGYTTQTLVVASLSFSFTC